MAKLLIFRGLPASGKSSIARGWVRFDPENRARVNRDELRKLVHDGKFIKGSKENPGTEQTIIRAEHAMVEKFLKAGLDVVDDNTNLPNRSVKALVEIAVGVGAEWQIVDFTDVPVEVCIERNHSRDTGVTTEVIQDLHRKFVKGKPYPLPFEYTPAKAETVEPYEPDVTKPKAIIIDIDGTVALNNGQRGFYEYDKVDLDEPNWPIIRVVREQVKAGYQPVFVSGRKDYCRDKTIEWLKEYVFPSGHFELWMRPTFKSDGSENNDKDYNVKLELFNKHIRHRYNVRHVFDDRNQVVQMWRKLGLTCFQVADGDF